MSAPVHDILHRLTDLGAEVERQADKLILRAGSAPVPKDVLMMVRQHKAEILEELSEEGRRDDVAERAAIIEHGGHIPRDWAEGFARLNADHPPGDVPLRRWQCFVDDVGRLLDSPLCAVAAALGWTAFDLFGCDQEKPFAHIDRAGLCWLIAGNRLVNLTAAAAIIETWTGTQQTYRRKPSEPSRVLAWELAG